MSEGGPYAFRPSTLYIRLAPDTKGESYDTLAQSTVVAQAAILPLALHGWSHGGGPMHEAVTYLIYWPIGIAIGGWLFFEIGSRM